MRILVVEDSRDLNRVIVKTLASEGYAADGCFDGEEALTFLACAQYDCIILDVMMPGLDGFTLVKRLRADGDATPVLFLTARDSVADRVTGLDSGGDYYLVKPFHYDELLACVRVMTRKHTPNRTNVYTLSDLTVDTAAHTVTRAGRDIRLSAKEFALLTYLISNKGAVLSREMIENHIWNYDYEGGTNVVDVYISYLRKKIDEGFDNKLIRTVWGRGWTISEANE